jgi:hypothetical protein
VAALTGDPKKASMILATIQSDQTLALLQQLQRRRRCAWQGAAGEAAAYAHPDFPRRAPARR